MTGLSEFTLFPDFPTELRLKYGFIRSQVRSALIVKNRRHRSKPARSRLAFQQVMSPEKWLWRIIKTAKEPICPTWTAWFDPDIDSVWAMSVLVHVTPRDVPSPYEREVPRIPDEEFAKIRIVALEMRTLTNFAEEVCRSLRRWTSPFKSMEALVVVLKRLDDDVEMGSLKEENGWPLYQKLITAMQALENQELTWFYARGRFPWISFDIKALSDKEVADRLGMK